jgi:hypothetical protein
MPRTPPPGGYPGPNYKPPKIKKPKEKKKKHKKAKKHKAKKPKTLKPKGFHESGNVGREEAGSKGDTGDDKVNAASGVGGGAPLGSVTALDGVRPIGVSLPLVAWGMRAPGAAASMRSPAVGSRV